MESVVIYNMGRDARRAGLPCVAPQSVMYPVRSRYVADHDVEAFLGDDMKREWRRGWYWQAGEGRSAYANSCKREKDMVA